MVTNQNFADGDAGQHQKHRFDPVLAEQIETTLDGVYGFNADTAKYGVLWVWLARLPRIAAGFAALVSLLVGLALVITGEDIVFGTPEIDPIGYVDWPLWFAAAAGFAVIATFMAFIAKAVSRSHRISIELASRYRTARS